jgi:hypothetical protein
MDSRTFKQKTSCFLVGLIISLFLYVPISQATEFYLSVAGGNGKEHCESLEIRGNTAACINQNKVTGYDLGVIQGVQIVNDGKIEFISKFTPASIARINASSQHAQEHEQSKIDHLVKRLKPVRSIGDLQQIGEEQYQQYGLNGVLHLLLPLVGATLILLGFFWIIIAAFRVHILWGIGCLIFPLVSLFFLFFHWRAAVKPFMLSVVGATLAYSGLYIFDEKREVSEQKKAVVTSEKKKTTVQKQSRFTCQGKKYCSQMTSCAEAKFYLQNCPGVKIDGDNDGVPCERQLCK